MTWRKAAFTIIALLTISTRIFAQERDADLQADQRAYCEYLSQQAMAQRDLLRTPSAISGITQPNESLPMQILWGVSASLSDMRKAGLTMDVAQKNCEVYSATTSAQQDIQYALPNLEKQALQHRLDLIQQASENLDQLTARMARMLEAQNVTRPMLFSLQTTRIKLNSDRADTQLKIAALHIPGPNDVRLKDLVLQKQASDAAEQKAVDKLNRQNNWDVSLSFGARQQINPLDNRGLYGAITVSYNLASRAIDKHLDQAASAYDDWKKIQQGDVTRNAEVLRQQLTSEIQAQETRLAALQAEQRQLDNNLQLVTSSDTAAALDFANQLNSTRLLLRLEIGDATFRLDQMRDFLEKNY